MNNIVVKKEKDCASKYANVMNILYNVEESVERMMKVKKASELYNKCLHINIKMNPTEHINISRR